MCTWKSGGCRAHQGTGTASSSRTPMICPKRPPPQQLLRMCEAVRLSLKQHQHGRPHKTRTSLCVKLNVGVRERRMRLLVVHSRAAKLAAASKISWPQPHGYCTAEVACACLPACMHTAAHVAMPPCKPEACYPLHDAVIANSLCALARQAKDALCGVCTGFMPAAQRLGMHCVGRIAQTQQPRGGWQPGPQKLARAPARAHATRAR